MSGELIEPQTHYLDCRSGEKITVLEYKPIKELQGIENKKGAILFTAALGVRQYYYRYLASYLTKQDYQVYSIDYSGIGFSKLRDIRKYASTTIQDWILEVEDALEWIVSRSDHKQPLFYISHSLGGQIFGLLNNNQRFSGMISITSQNGYYKYYASKKFGYFIFWHIIVPPVTKIVGYFPSKWFNLGEALPKKIGLSWKKWCTSPNYFFDDPLVPQVNNFVNYIGPILTLSFNDDPWATELAVDSLVSHYSNASIEHRHLNPTDFGLSSIGHLGYFRPKCQHMWKELVDWMSSQSDELED